MKTLLKFLVIVFLFLFISCKPYNLDFGERYLVRNYEKKKRKKIKKYLENHRKPRK